MLKLACGARRSRASDGSAAELFLFRCQGAASARAVVPLENSIASTSIFDSPSYKEPTVDALAPEADEGRGMAAKSHGELPTKLRSVDVRMGKPGTRHGVSLRPERIGPAEGTGGIETSQYPEEKKATATP